MKKNKTRSQFNEEEEDKTRTQYNWEEKKVVPKNNTHLIKKKQKSRNTETHKYGKV